MHSFIAVVFPDEAKAYDGLHALESLHRERAITLNEVAVVERDPNGGILIQLYRNREPPLRRTEIGALVGALAGLLGGPAGVVLGGAVGILGGAVGEAVHEAITDDYVHRIGEHLKPGTYAVVAEVHEKTPAVIDTRMSAFEGKVIRDTKHATFDEAFASSGS